MICIFPTFWKNQIPLYITARPILGTGAGTTPLTIERCVFARAAGASAARVRRAAGRARGDRDASGRVRPHSVPAAEAASAGGGAAEEDRRQGAAPRALTGAGEGVGEYDPGVYGDRDIQSAVIGDMQYWC